jgi:CDP-glucose 4,6-dehydratase
MRNEFWTNKNVFVTGANGFVGSWLTKSLVKKRANVIILVRDTIPSSTLRYINGIYEKLGGIVSGSTVDYSLVERIFNEYEIDTCFHLAAQTIVGIANRSPLSTFESNIKGTWNILEAARNSELLERLVVASSDKAYGKHERLPYREDYCLHASHPYDASKACTDILAYTYYYTYELPVAITRCANIYGGGDLNFSRLIPGTIRSLSLDEKPVIRSDGTPVRDYIYILDTINAYLTLAEQLHRKDVKGQAFNFGTETPINVVDLVNKILHIYGKTDLKPVILGKGKPKGEIDVQYLSIDKARKVLEWAPQYDLDAGLKETILWYKTFFQKRQII